MQGPRSSNANTMLSHCAVCGAYTRIIHMYDCALNCTWQQMSSMSLWTGYNDNTTFVCKFNTFLADGARAVCNYHAYRNSAQTWMHKIWCTAALPRSKIFLVLCATHSLSLQHSGTIFVNLQFVCIVQVAGCRLQVHTTSNSNDFSMCATLLIC